MGSEYFDFCHPSLRDGSTDVGRSQAIPDSTFGQDVLRLRWINLDLLPQLSNVDAQILSVGEFIAKL
jgi:hypothetical protein